MPSRTLQVVLDLDTGRYSGRISKAGEQMRVFSGDVTKSSKSVNTLGSAFDRFHSHMNAPLAKLRDYVLILGNIRLAILNVRDLTVGWTGDMLKQASEMQRLLILMQGMSTATTMAGQMKEAQESLAGIMNLSRQTGFDVHTLADAFVKMKSAGIDPLKGSMTGLTNAVAAFGGDSELMHRSAIAIQQMAGKGVISMEELRQQLGEAVPTAMFDMATAAGMSLQKFVKLVSKGMVQAKPAIQLMMNEFNRLYAGAGQRMANTLEGQIAQFKTNLLQIATNFTQLNDSTLVGGNGTGLFQGTVDALKQINQEMQSNEVKQFAASVGSAVDTVLQDLLKVANLAVRFRGEIGSAFTAIVTYFVAIRAVRIAAWFKELGATAVANLRNIGTALQGNDGLFSGLIQRMDNYRAANQRAQIGTAQWVEILRNKIATNRASAEANAVEATSLEELSAAYRNQIVLLERQEKQELAELNTARTLAAARNATSVEQVRRTQAVQQAEETLNRTRKTIIVTNRALAKTEAELATARTAETEATTTATLAEERLAIAEEAAAAATSLAARASAAAAAAVGFLGRAVNVALGPIGIIALALYTAAEAAGVFTNKAEKAAEAAKRLRDGMGSLEDMKETMKRQGSIKDSLNDINDSLKAGGMWITGPNSIPTFHKFTAKEVDSLHQQADELKREYARNARSLTDFKSDYDEREADRYVRRLENTQNTTEAKVANIYRNYQKQQRELLDSGKITQKQFNDRIDAKGAEIDKDRLAAWQKMRDNTQAARDAMAKAGKSTTQLDLALGKLDDKIKSVSSSMGGSTQSLRDQLIGTAKGTSEAEKAAKRAAKAFAAAREKYTNMIGSVEGRIAEMKAQIDGGDKALGQFEAKLKAGMFKDATPAEIERLKKDYKELDDLSQKLDFTRGINRLNDQIARSASESDQLWTSIANGTYDADKRLAQLKGRFGDLLEAAKGNPENLAQVQTLIDKWVRLTQSADTADMVHSWQLATQQIQNSLDDTNAGRQKEYDEEVRRQWDLANIYALTGERRKQAEQAFYNWRHALWQKTERESEGATLQMARGWVQLGKNMDEALSGALNNYVESLISGKASMFDFFGELLKELAKVILKALIAYAIMSALGLGTGAGGTHQSLGEFLKGGIRNFGQSITGTGISETPVSGFSQAAPDMPMVLSVAHDGGVIGAIAKRMTVSAEAFENVARYHGGGSIADLKSGEVPIIGKAGEIVLNEAQQNNIANGLTKTPNVEVNIINNSGTPLNAEKSQPRFDGKKWVIGVVVDAMHKEGPMRNAIKSVMGGK